MPFSSKSFRVSVQRSIPFSIFSNLIDFNRKSPEEILYQDFKTFTVGQYEFGVAQLSAMSREELETVHGKLKLSTAVQVGERNIKVSEIIAAHKIPAIRFGISTFFS